MGIYEFDQELHDRVLLEDGEAIGIKKGIEIGKNQGIEIGMEIGIRIYKNIMEGNTDTKRLAEAIGCSMEEVEKIRKQFEI